MPTLWSAPSTTRAAEGGSTDAAANAVVVPNRLVTEAATSATRAGRPNRRDFGHMAAADSNIMRARCSEPSSLGSPGAVAAAIRSASFPCWRFGNPTTVKSSVPELSKGRRLVSTMETHLRNESESALGAACDSGRGCVSGTGQYLLVLAVQRALQPSETSVTQDPHGPGRPPHDLRHGRHIQPGHDTEHDGFGLIGWKLCDQRHGRMGGRILVGIGLDVCPGRDQIEL
jgi:hypothetical protein